MPGCRTVVAGYYVSTVKSVDLRTASAETFEPVVTSEFRSGEPAASLVLAEVVRHPVQPHAPRPEPFSLVFTGSSNVRLAQGTYRLGHPDLGELEIFLVPIGHNAQGGFLYEAVFN